MHTAGHRGVRPGLLLAALLAACTDSPVQTGPAPEAPAGPPAPAITLQAIVCNGDVAGLALACGSPAAIGGSTDIVYGGQNLYVKLTSSNVAYNGGTGQFTFDVTLQNLIEQPIGTLDGNTPAPGGVRVFFGEGPTVTGGSGTIAVLPDGFDTFTAPAQPFYAYGSVLTQGQTSAGRTWTLIVQPTVTTFSFVVYVSSPVPHPTGYITLDGLLPGSSMGSMHPTDTHSLVAVSRTAVGTVVPGTSITFGTSDPDCAQVGPAGAVTPVQAGSCTLTANDGMRAGSVTLQVTGATRVWDGSESSDWSLGANWVGGRVPVALDSASIPFAVPNFPTLSGSAAVAGVEVADGATLSLAAHHLTATADVTTGPTPGSGILASGGVLRLDGAAGSVRGRVPSVLVTGAYSLSGDLFVVAPEQVDAGSLRSEGYHMLVVSQ